MDRSGRPCWFTSDLVGQPACRAIGYCACLWCGNFQRRIMPRQPIANRRCNRLGCQFAHLALPDDSDTPTGLKQQLPSSPVSLDIDRKFVPPVVTICRRRAGVPATFVPMPEATVNENDRVVLWKNEIRRSRQTSSVKPETEACAVQGTPHFHFGPGIPAPDARHHAGAGCLVNNVRQ